MENIVVAMFLAILAIESKDKKFLFVVVTGCLMSEIIYMTIHDSVLYYSIMSALAATLAIESVTVTKTVGAKVYALLMYIQAIICALLIPSFSIVFNSFAESLLTYYNDSVLIIVSIACIIGTNNIITERFYEN